LQKHIDSILNYFGVRFRRKSRGNHIIFGFDSAWANNPKSPGAITAVAFGIDGTTEFLPPVLVNFDQAEEWIQRQRSGFDYALVAIDQPTIVPNASGMRPVEKVAGSLVSFVGGGVQPANRKPEGFFEDQAPIWQFLSKLGARQAPEEARVANEGLFLIEVFPALALPSMNERFAERLAGPKYNPKQKKAFSIRDWGDVCRTIIDVAAEFQVFSVVEWLEEMELKTNPTKADQDMLDAVICCLIGVVWKYAERGRSVLIGDTNFGYMVSPVSPPNLERLRKKAKNLDLEID
jgi:predicted RNase H-like nuclease